MSRFACSSGGDAVLLYRLIGGRDGLGIAVVAPVGAIALGSAAEAGLITRRTDPWCEATLA